MTTCHINLLLTYLFLAYLGIVYTLSGKYLAILALHGAPQKEKCVGPLVKMTLTIDQRSFSVSRHMMPIFFDGIWLLCFFRWNHHLTQVLSKNRSAHSTACGESVIVHKEWPSLLSIMTFPVMFMLHFKPCQSTMHLCNLQYCHFQIFFWVLVKFNGQQRSYILNGPCAHLRLWAPKNPNNSIIPHFSKIGQTSPRHEYAHMQTAVTTISQTKCRDLKYLHCCACLFCSLFQSGHNPTICANIFDKKAGPLNA